MLMADHQMTGGYSVVVTVISVDFQVTSQLKTLAWGEFESCSPAEAVRAVITQERVLMAASE